MKPHSIGRTLGIGLRVAARVAGQRASASAPAGGVASPTASAASVSGLTQPAAVDTAAQARANGQVAGQVGQVAGRVVAGAGGSVARGVAGFLRPFRRVGGILWLEVMGVFFLVFVVAFAPTLWRTRASYASGPDHRTFLVSAAVTAVFLYLGVSSFWRARRK
jgi:hypothetical protein